MPPPQSAGTRALRGARPRVVVIGASTGGTDALRVVLASWPAGGPAVVVAQHLPDGMEAELAAQLAARCAATVVIARAGDVVQAGHVYLAPTGWHTCLEAGAGACRLRLCAGTADQGHVPSIDELFASAARCLGARAIGVLLTGMGDDGARGLLALKQAGAVAIVQDESSCLVPDMPRAARSLGAADHVVALAHLAADILRRAD